MRLRPRLPFLVISPYAKRNYVDHAVNDQTSILRFIEDKRSRDGCNEADCNEADCNLGNFAFTTANSGEVARAR